MIIPSLLLLLQLLTLSTAFPGTRHSNHFIELPRDTPQASQPIYTGFSYGAFWSESEPKRYKDFLRQFTLARNLPNVPVPFTSARLYQAAQWGSPQEPSEAFQAAVETNTTLLIGLWLPVDNELIALDKAFEKHGQKLADLVIGIAVGNEDIYRSGDDCSRKEGRPCPMSATSDQVTANITHVKDWLQQKPWSKLFATPPPIGHADTDRNAALDHADFIGVNIFPFWGESPIDTAWENFQQTLKGVQDRAGKTPVWITETGWPSAGKDPNAKLENMQRYWTAVACPLLGRQTTFWFELERDTHDVGELDWGIIDIPSQKPKVADLRCPEQPGGLPVASSVGALPSSSPVSGAVSVPIPTLSGPKATSEIPQSPGTSLAQDTSTVVRDPIRTHVTITSTITLPLSPEPTNQITTQITIHTTLTSTITVHPGTTIQTSTTPHPSTTLQPITTLQSNTTIHPNTALHSHFTYPTSHNTPAPQSSSPKPHAA